MDVLGRNKGRAEAGLVFAVLAIIVGAFVAGLVAFLYLKLRKHNQKEMNYINLIKVNLIIAIVVTICMYLGSSAGSVITGFLYSSKNIAEDDMLLRLTNKLAITFFFETLIALLWTSYIYIKHGNNKLKEKVYSWVGLYVIFVLYNSLLVFNINLSNILDVFSYSFIVNFYHAVEFNFLNSVYGVLFIIQEPVEYVKQLFENSRGNQFLMVKEFPKWSVLFMSLILLYVPTFGNGFSSYTDDANPSS